MILERGKEPYKFTLTLMAVAAWSILVNCALADNLPAEDTVKQLRPLLVANRRPASGKGGIPAQAQFSCSVIPPSDDPTLYDDVKFFVIHQADRNRQRDVLIVDSQENKSKYPRACYTNSAPSRNILDIVCHADGFTFAVSLAPPPLAARASTSTLRESFKPLGGLGPT